MKSTMFLNNITAIDHAYIDQNGQIVGGSVNPTMHVTGTIDEVEKVVVDFSTVKKSIKHIIDAKYSGFDHKLWIIEGYSNCRVIEAGGVNIDIETPLFSMTAPRDAFKFIKTPVNLYGVVDMTAAVINQMEQEIMQEMAMLHKGVGIEVSIDFDECFYGNPRMDTDMIPFRYTHGLKSSTSWGCQNIAHGHLSYLAAESDDPELSEDLLKFIADDIDGTIFVYKDNIVDMNEAGIEIGYETGRGTFGMLIDADYASAKIVILKTETTVEFLAEAIAQQYRTELKNAGVKRLFVSEGLNKGAVAVI